MTEQPQDPLEPVRVAVFEHIADAASYFVHPGERQGVRYFPSGELFNLVVWNVAVAFLVNVFSDLAGEWVREWKERKREQKSAVFSAEQLAGIRSEIRAALQETPPAQLRVLLARAAPPTAEIAAVLVEFGVPRARAETIAAPLEVAVKTALQASSRE